MSSSDSSEQIVIIAGSGRSGTSWLGSILNSYEKAEYFYEITNYRELDFGQPELHRIKYPLTYRWGNRPRWARNAERRLLAMRAHFGPRPLEAQRSLRIFAQDDFAKDHPDVQLYKIVTLFGFVQRCAELAERFQRRLKVVHLIRNPYAQIASELRMDKRDPDGSKGHFKRRVVQVLEDPRLSEYHALAQSALERSWVFQMALVWRVSNERMIKCDDLDKKLVVYEQLCSEPMAVVSDLFSYLGWEMSDQTARYVKQTSEVSPTEAESGYYSLRKNSQESLNRWRKELDEQSYKDAAEAIADSFLPRFWSETELALRD